MIGFGCVKLTSLPSLNEAVKLLGCAFENGIRWFDTAPLYGQGYSEQILGRFLKSLNSNDRHEIKLVTKFGLGKTSKNILPIDLALRLNHFKNKRKKLSINIASEKNLDFPNKRIITKEYIEKQFNLSRKRLNVETLHGYLGHELAPQWLTDEANLFLEDRVTKGEITALGLGTNVPFILENTDEIKHSRYNLLQFNFNDQQQIVEMITMFPQCEISTYGFFTGANGQDGIQNIKQLQLTHPKVTILFSTANKDRLISNLRKLYL